MEDKIIPTVTKIKNAPKWWTYQRILNKVVTEYTDGLNYTEQKRQKKRDQLKLYVNQEKEEERISDNTLYSTMQTWMAVSVSDQKQTLWLGRKWDDEEVAQNLNNLSKFDWDEMNMPEYEIKRRWYEWMFGLSIIIQDGYDKRREVPTFSVRDPMTWVPDRKWWMRSGNFRFMSFDSSCPAYELTAEKWYFNIDVAQKGTKSSTTQRNEVAYAEPRILNGSTESEYYDGNEIISIVDHYTKINGIPYIISTANDNSILIRFEQVPAATKAEKEDPTLIPFPVVLRYFSPIPNDPFGISLADLCEDPQKAMTILKNLKLIQQKDAALGDTFLVDENKVTNRTDLLKAPSLTRRRFIGTLWDPNNAIASLPKNPVNNDYYNFEQSLRGDMQLTTGIGNVQSGAIEDTKRTAKEIQSAEVNANKRFMLGFKIALIADKEFWRLWYRSYQKNLTDKSKKFVRINSGMTPKVTTLGRMDIVSIEDPDVVLDSEDNILRINNSLRDSWLATYQFYMADPTTPEIAKILFKRKFYQIVNKMTKEESYLYVPQTATEMMAWEDVKLLNRDEMVQVDDINADHMAFYIIYNYAEDTKAKFASIEMRKLAIIMQGQQQSIAQQSWVGNQTQGQVINNMMQTSNKETALSPNMQ